VIAGVTRPTRTVADPANQAATGGVPPHMWNWLARRDFATIKRVVRPRAAVVVLATAAALVSLSLPAQALRADPGDILVNQPDPAGDVKLFTKYHGPTKPMRRSIDLLGFSVVLEADGIQMTVKLKRILGPKSGYDQVIEVQMAPSDSSYFWFDDVTMSGQEPTESYASFSPSLDGSDLQTCGPITASVDTVGRTVSMFVPNDCLPDTAAKIKVFSSLGHYRAEGVGYSLDRMKIAGAHVLK
jgi:hypothetical protein